LPLLRHSQSVVARRLLADSVEKLAS